MEVAEMLSNVKSLCRVTRTVWIRVEISQASTETVMFPLFTYGKCQLFFRVFVPYKPVLRPINSIDLPESNRRYINLQQTLPSENANKLSLPQFITLFPYPIHFVAKSTVCVQRIYKISASICNKLDIFKHTKHVHVVPGGKIKCLSTLLWISSVCRSILTFII